MPRRSPRCARRSSSIAKELSGAGESGAVLFCFGAYLGSNISGENTGTHFDRAVHHHGALPGPLESFIEGFDLPQRESRDHFLGLGKGPVSHREVLACVLKAFGKLARHESAVHLVFQNAGGDEGLVVVVHGHDRLFTGRDHVFGASDNFVRIMTFIDHLPVAVDSASRTLAKLPCRHRQENKLVGCLP